jgi:hypothetical protein
MMEEEKLADVHPDETFKTSHGKEVKSLKHLQHVLEDISPESFKHHVNGEKNDFANWIRNAVKDPELADQMEQTVDFEETKELVAQRVEFLERRVEIRKIKESLDSIASQRIDPVEPIKVEQSEEPPQPQPTVPKIDLNEHVVPTVHPFEHLKKSIWLSVRDGLIGFFIGLLVGYGVSLLA